MGTTIEFLWTALVCWRFRERGASVNCRARGLSGKLPRYLPTNALPAHLWGSLYFYLRLVSFIKALNRSSHHLGELRVLAQHARFLVALHA